MKTMLIAALLLPAASFAGHSDVRIFSCKVLSFDRAEVKASCNPKKPKSVMKIPREWLSSGDDNLKLNALVHVPVNTEQFKQWMAMNSGGKK